MRYLLILCGLVVFATSTTYAADIQKVSAAQFDELVIKTKNGLLLNNFNFVIEKGYFGGSRATIQCSGRNKTGHVINYTVYIAAFTKDDELVACFNLGSMMMSNASGKIKAHDESGMLEMRDKDAIHHFVIKVVEQRPER